MKTKKQKHTPGTKLDERAMLVHLSIGFWEGRKIDEDKSKDITTKARATRDAGVWSTQIIPKDAVNHIRAARGKARAIHFEYTLPWQDTGFRILPAAMFIQYTAAMRKAEIEFNKVVATFLKAFPEHVKKAASRLGSLYKKGMFPSDEELAEKFPWTLKFTPVPTAGDFRVDLGAETTNDIRKSIERQTEAAMAEAMEELWYRLHDSVSKIAERLNDPEGVFRDSLIENVAKLVELLPKMNITGNPKLETLRQEVARRLSKQEPEALRKNKPARADAAKAAEDILKKMQEFIPKRK